MKLLDSVVTVSPTNEAARKLRAEIAKAFGLDATEGVLTMEPPTTTIFSQQEPAEA